MVVAQESLNLSLVQASAGLWKEKISGKDHKLPCKRPADDRGRIFEGNLLDLNILKFINADEDSKHDNFVQLSYGDLAGYTDDFSESNYIGYFQYGEFYRGKIVRSEFIQNVLVKSWHIPEGYRCLYGDNEMRLVDEIILHSNKLLIDHDGIMKLYGYCLEGDKIGVVYDFDPFISLFDIVLDDDFTWLQRIKVAIKLANLLALLHGPKFLEFQHGTDIHVHKPLIVCNLDCAHILLDKDYNPKLCDFGMVTGGIFPDRTKYHPRNRGCYGYVDLASRVWSDKTDVFVFGSILTSLVSKRVYDKDEEGGGEVVSEWAFGKYLDDFMLESEIKPEFTLIHESFVADPDFKDSDGRSITCLAIECFEDIEERPSMEKVLQSLCSLQIVKEKWGVVSQ